jgi:SAM-dependent methyltransferase
MTVSDSRWGNTIFTQNLARRVWTASAVVRRYLHRLASGSEDIDWWTSVAIRHPCDLDPLLVLGCGSGGLERLAAERGIASRVFACDLEPSTLHLAEQSRQSDGIQGLVYFLCDLDRPDFPITRLGGVIAHDTIHHVRELELLLARLRDLLRPSGTLAFCEYTGPSRFQYPDQQLEILNDYLHRIPARLRIHPDSGRVVDRISRVDPEVLAREDPSEAIRSEDVLPATLEQFTPEIVRPYNGALLNPLLQDIIVNFDSDEGQAVLEYLCEQEQQLTEANTLTPNFMLFEGRSK